MQSCRDQADLKLTLLKPSDQDDEPEVRDIPPPGTAADSGARVLAVSDTSAAIYLPGPRPRVVIYDETGNEVSSTELPAPPDLAGPQNAAVSRRRPDHLVDGPRPGGVQRHGNWRSAAIIPGRQLTLLGPATMMANQLLLPVVGGLAVYEASAGTFERMIAGTAGHPGTGGSRGGGQDGAEQRGDTVVALG